MTKIFLYCQKWVNGVASLYGWSISNPTHTVWVEHFKPITHSMGGAFQPHHTQYGWNISNPSHSMGGAFQTHHTQNGWSI